MYRLIDIRCIESVFIMSRNDARGQCSFGMLLLHFVPFSFNIYLGVGKVVWNSCIHLP